MGGLAVCHPVSIFPSPGIWFEGIPWLPPLLFSIFQSVDQWTEGLLGTFCFCSGLGHNSGRQLDHLRLLYFKQNVLVWFIPNDTNLQQESLARTGPVLPSTHIPSAAVFDSHTRSCWVCECSLLSSKGKIGVFPSKAWTREASVWSWRGSWEGIFAILPVPAPHFPGKESRGVWQVRVEGIQVDAWWALWVKWFLHWPIPCMDRSWKAPKHCLCLWKEVLARGDRLRGRGRLHSVSSFPGSRQVWEESRAFWQSSLLVSDLVGPVLYHRATVRLSVTRHRH